MAGRICGLILISQGLAGCSDVDWNWDTTWWEPPKRTVRPIRPSPPGAKPGEFAYAPRTSGQYTPRPAETASESTYPEFIAESTVSSPAPGESGSSRQAVLPPAPPQPTAPGVVASQAFYQLYLASSGAAEQPVPGTARVILSRARPRAMATVLESLYPPVGRSGSDVESYLMYEQREEFDAARTMVSALDVSPVDGRGGGNAFETGVGMYYAILAQDASVDKAMVKACQSKLDEARQSGGVDRQRNWAASLLKGRLASEFTYEYPVAIAAFDEAAKIGGEGTLEHMVALWWGADALRMEGGRAAARRNLEQIVNSYGKWAQSQVVRRAKAALGQGR